MRSTKGITLNIDVSLVGEVVRLFLRFGSPVVVFNSAQAETTDIYDVKGHIVRVWLDTDLNEEQQAILLVELGEIKSASAWMPQLWIGSEQIPL